MRVIALTSGRDVPSSRFRVRQFIGPLKSHGLDVREITPAMSKYAGAPMRGLGPLWTAAKGASRVPGVLASWRADVVWLERELLPGRYTLERLLKRPVLLDLDDAVWLGAEDAIQRLVRRSTGVIAGNAYIADYCRAQQARAWVVPTCIDTARWVPPPTARPRDRLRLVWSGSGGNLPALEALDAPIAVLMRESGAVELVVVSDRPPRLPSLPDARVHFVPWSPAVEAQALQDCDVGIMPLADTPWSRGKCAFKMLQYMATELPVVVSPVGVNLEVLARGPVGLAAAGAEDWVNALRRLRDDAALRVRLGTCGRQVVEEHYSLPVGVSRLSEIFHSMVRESPASMGRRRPANRVSRE